MSTGLESEIKRRLQLTRPFSEVAQQTRLQSEHATIKVCRSPEEWHRLWPKLERDAERFNLITLDTESEGQELKYVIVGTPSALVVILDAQRFGQNHAIWRDRLPRDLIRLLESDLIAKVGRGIREDMEKDFKSIDLKRAVDIAETFMAHEEDWYGRRTYGGEPRSSLGWAAFCETSHELQAVPDDREVPALPSPGREERTRSRGLPALDQPKKEVATVVPVQ